MSPERYQIVLVEGHGYGIVRKQYAHFAEVELHDGYNAWNIIVQNDEFEVVEQINLGHEEVT